MGYDMELVDLQEQQTAVVRGHVAFDGIADFLSGAFGEVTQALQSQSVSTAGPPFAQYAVRSDGFDIEAGFPTATSVAPTGRVTPGVLPAGRTARTLHHGAYSDVVAAYDALGAWLPEDGYRPSGAPWESYLDAPDVPQPRTMVYMPCVAVRHG
jgi:effector-binding domain-containing protein